MIEIKDLFHIFDSHRPNGTTMISRKSSDDMNLPQIRFGNSFALTSSLGMPTMSEPQEIVDPISQNCNIVPMRKRNIPVATDTKNKRTSFSLKKTHSTLSVAKKTLSKTSTFHKSIIHTSTPTPLFPDSNTSPSGTNTSTTSTPFHISCWTIHPNLFEMQEVLLHGRRNNIPIVYTFLYVTRVSYFFENTDFYLDSKQIYQKYYENFINFL